MKDQESCFAYSKQKVSAIVKDHVKDKKKVFFEFYRSGILYYKTEDGFLFEVPCSDCADAVFNKEDKALLFMRYIAKQVEKNQLAMLEINAARAGQEFRKMTDEMDREMELEGRYERGCD